MNDSNLKTPQAIAAFLQGTQLSELTVDKISSYSFIGSVAKTFESEKRVYSGQD